MAALDFANQLKAQFGDLLSEPAEFRGEITLVVADAFPLPIEGFETRVVADDQEVLNHMIALGDTLEMTRKEVCCFESLLVLNTLSPSQKRIN